MLQVPEELLGNLGGQKLGASAIVRALLWATRDGSQGAEGALLLE